MSYDKDDLIAAVESNVEDFYGDIEVEPDEIPQMAVEDALNAFDVPQDEQFKVWDELMEVATRQYEILNDDDHRRM